ncbi:hypothetical protein WR25_18031, partial [Diploscapter pachys]
MLFLTEIKHRENKEKSEWERTEALMPRIEDSRCGEQLDDEVTFITYASSNHFAESRAAILSLRSNNFTNKIIYYNLGLASSDEIYREFKAFWIIDSSIRFVNLTEWRQFNERVRSGAVEPFALRLTADHSIFAATQAGIYEYLPLNVSIARKNMMFAAHTMFVVRSSFAREAVK